MPGFTGQTDWFAVARELTDPRIGVGDPRMGEAGAAPADDPVPARDPFGPSPAPSHLTGWRLAGCWAAVTVGCLVVWAGIVALIWWAAT